MYGRLLCGRRRGWSPPLSLPMPWCTLRLNVQPFAGRRASYSSREHGVACGASPPSSSTSRVMLRSRVAAVVEGAKSRPHVPSGIGTSAGRGSWNCPGAGRYHVPYVPAVCRWLHGYRFLRIALWSRWWCGQTHPVPPMSHLRISSLILLSHMHIAQHHHMYFHILCSH